MQELCATRFGSENDSELLASFNIREHVNNYLRLKPATQCQFITFLL